MPDERNTLIPTVQFVPAWILAHRAGHWWAEVLGRLPASGLPLHDQYPKPAKGWTVALIDALVWAADGDAVPRGIAAEGYREFLVFPDMQPDGRIVGMQGILRWEVFPTGAVALHTYKLGRGNTANYVSLTIQPDSAYVLTHQNADTELFNPIYNALYALGAAPVADKAYRSMFIPPDANVA